MSDNTVLNAGTGGDVISTDDIAGVKVQRVKVQYGTDGAATDVSTTNPMPINDAGGSVTVDGTIAATQSGAWNVTNVSGTVSLPTGASTSANQSTQITSLSSIDTSITNLSKAEDAGHTTGDKGIAALAVRQDADASLADTTLDYTPLQVDANGFLKVNIKAGAGSGGTASTDDAAFTVAAGSGTPMMGIVTSDSVDSGDAGVVGMLANRQLKVTLYNSGGTEISVGGGTQYTEDAVSANDPIGNALIVVRDDSLAGSVVSANGDNIALRGNNKGELYVKHTDAVPVTDNSGSLTVDNGGTFAVQATLAAETTKVIGTINVAAAQTIATTIAAGATNIAKAEDAAAASGDTGVYVLSVRQDTLSSSTSADGDYASVKSSSTGAVYVNVAEGGISARAEDAASAGGEDGVMVLAVRRDAASSGVSADGDFAALSVDSNGALRVSGSAGTTQYTEDAASAGAESLCLIGAVRRDTAASSGGTDGDYVTVNTDSAGRVWVNASGVAVPITDNSGSITVDNGGTFAVQSTIAASSTNIAKAEDVASADADVGVPAMAVRKATPANTSGTDGDYEMLQMSAGRMWTSTVVDTALPAGTNAIGKLAANSGVDIGDVDVTSVPTDPFGANADAASATGSISAKLRFIAATGIPVTGTVTVGSHAVTNAGTFAVQNTAQASTGTQEIVGDVADDAVAAGNPVLVCGVAVETDGTDPTTVSAEGDAAQVRTDRQRILLVNQTNPRSFFTAVDYASAQTNASIQAAPGASLSLYITDLVISNGATAGKITLLDGSGGTVKFVIYPSINGGAALTLRSPIRLTANTALCITSTTVTTHSVNVGGYIAP